MVPMGFVEDEDRLTGILDCEMSSLTLKYLGLPSRASYKAKPIWGGVIEKIECRLAS